jgi:TP901-1 family phage major tail protein|tara:strand:- start:1907 stop:2341 length:435 start_codon:yes stop_codon:yes gene_type:complete
MAASTSVMNSTDVIVRIGTDGSTWETVGKMTSASLSVTMATRDTSTKDSAGWMEVLEGQKSWTLSGEGLVVYNDAGKATPDDIYTFLSGRTVVYIEFGSESTDEKYYSGTGYFTDFSTDAGVEDNSTYSFSFQGTAVLTQGTQA